MLPVAAGSVLCLCAQRKMPQPGKWMGSFCSCKFSCQPFACCPAPPRPGRLQDVCGHKQPHHNKQSQPLPKPRPADGHREHGNEEGEICSALPPDSPAPGSVTPAGPTVPGSVIPQDPRSLLRSQAGTRPRPSRVGGILPSRCTTHPPMPYERHLRN